MLWRIAVVLVGGGFVLYRVSLWLEIRKARRTGDTRREEQLRRHGFGLYRWVLIGLLVLIAVLTALVWNNSR